MKSLETISVLVLAMALSVPSFAAGKNQGSFTLSNQARIGSTDLKAGDYKAEWTPQSGDSVKVDILKNGKVVATTTGKVKNLDQASRQNAVVLRSLDNNTSTIDEIDFSNRREALVLGGE